jgi:hypothetical protein
MRQADLVQRGAGDSPSGRGALSDCQSPDSRTLADFAVLKLLSEALETMRLGGWAAGRWPNRSLPKFIFLLRETLRVSQALVDSDSKWNRVWP